MNHTFPSYSINLNQSNSIQSYIPGTSYPAIEGVFAGMNSSGRSPSPDNNDDGANKNDKTMVPLHDNFTPGDDDVICGRGKKCYAHTGNERFRRIVMAKLEKYSAASSRPEKSEILSSIVAEVRLNSPEGGFVKQDTSSGKWFEVGDFLAREKTSQAFRDALHENYRSSKKSKHEKRRQRTKAKAMSEKRSGASSGHFHEGDNSSDHMMFPPLNSSPLVSRQQLTTLREEPAHPRAYSFSGRSHDPRSRVASRTLSLSSGRGVDHDSERLGGRLNDGRSDLLYGEQYYRDSAPPLYHDDRSISGEELASFHQGERLDSRHDSWPQTYPGSHAAMFMPPAAFHASAPQFHPVGANDVAAHRSYPDQMSYHNSEAIMKEVGGVCADNVSSHWSTSERDVDTQPLGAASSGSHLTDTRAYAASPGSATMAAYSSGKSRSSSDRAHQRNNSTAAASAIVAQLASSIKQETLEVGDENPFEPIPLGGGHPKKARSGESTKDSW